MFKKETVSPEKVDTIVGQHSHFEGTIRGKGCVRIEGQVTGVIDYQGDVVVGETAKVDANVSGRNITIAGTVKGDVRAVGKLELVKGGNFIGDAEHSQLVIAPGAYFLGQSKPAGESSDQPGAKRVPRPDRPAEQVGKPADDKDKGR